MIPRLLIVTALALCSVACVYQPHQSTQAVDDRPQVSFDWQLDNLDPRQAELHVDGQSFGAVANYLYPDNSVPVLIGRHKVEIKVGQEVVFETEEYFGEKQSYTLEVR